MKKSPNVRQGKFDKKEILVDWSPEVHSNPVKQGSTFNPSSTFEPHDITILTFLLFIRTHSPVHVFNHFLILGGDPSACRLNGEHKGGSSFLFSSFLRLRSGEFFTGIPIPFIPNVSLLLLFLFSLTLSSITVFHQRKETPVKNTKKSSRMYQVEAIDTHRTVSKRNRQSNLFSALHSHVLHSE